MVKCRVLLLLLIAALPGCRYIFIPGTVIGGVSDLVTGDRGFHCITSSSKVGDSINLTSGGSLVVQSISGKSRRCSNDQYPIRALLVRPEGAVAVRPAT